MRVQETNNAALRQKGISDGGGVHGTPETVHAVYILDRSGSMDYRDYKNGSLLTRYAAATFGLKADFEEIKKIRDVKYTLTFIEFDSPSFGSNITEHFFMVPIEQVGSIQFTHPRGGTPLNQTVGETIDKINKLKKTGEKVIMNVFTDGGENTSKGEYANAQVLKARIKKAEEEGFTVTFQGTQEDVQYAINNLGLHSSNTLIHDNSANSILRAAKARGSSMVMYSKAVADGEDVSRGFYTKTMKEE